jgi:hypothetical protein
MYPIDVASLERVGILDVRTRALWILDPIGSATTGLSTFDWTGPGSLTLRGWTRGQVPADMPVKVSFSPDLAAIVARSRDGSWTATGLPNESRVTVSHDGASRDYALPGVVNQLIWSNDGHRLLIECGWDPSSDTAKPYVVVLTGLG